MNPVFDETTGMFYVALEGGESAEAVLDACAEVGAVFEDGALHLHINGQRLRMSRQELRRYVLERGR